jgi:hypothetical protein
MGIDGSEGWGYDGRVDTEMWEVELVIFIGGVSQGQKILSEGLVRLCGSCGSHGRYQVIMTYMYFSFFFIPLFKWNRRYYVKMDCCEAVYELDPVVGKAVLRGENPDIAEADLRLVQAGRYAKTWQEGSKKCMRCGFETDEDYNYCPVCGGRI